MVWDVVVFREDNSVEYVPSSWAVDSAKTVYLWPKIKSQCRVRRLIDEGEPPQFDVEYYECLALCKATVNDIESAKTLMTQLIQNPSSTDEEQADNDDVNASCINTENSDSDSANISQDTTHVPDDETSDSNETMKETFKKILRDMTAVMAEIKFEAKEFRKEFTEFKQAFLEFRHEHVTHQIAGNASMPAMPFPYKTEESLQELEASLTDKKTFENLVVSFVAVGGDEKKKLCTRIFKRFLTKELALQFSSLGRKGKKSFSTFVNLNKVITDAVRYKDPNATDLQITRMIGSVLANAGDWEGGRKERDEKAERS